MPSKKKLTEEQQAELKKLREEGWTFAALGEHFGVSYATAHLYVKGHTKVIEAPEEMGRFLELAKRLKKQDEEEYKGLIKAVEETALTFLVEAYKKELSQ